ncbi:MAG: dihydrolipoamide acetyltransferase family protein [Bacteroidales bacterium]
MRYIFKFPDIGEGLDEGTIVEWHVDKGATVKMGDSLVTMETDKVVTAIPSPKDGVIVAKFGKVGETIKVGAALVEIEIEGEENKEAQSEAKKEELVEEEGAGVVGTLEVASNELVLSASSEGVEIKRDKRDGGKIKALATPVARAMAKEMGVDINLVKGTGPGGRVTKSDIQNWDRAAHLKSTKIEAKREIVELVEIEPLSQMRKSIAKNMIQSKQKAAHMTLFEEVEVSELDRVRREFKLTYLPYIVKAVAITLKKHRVLNSEMDWEGGNMIYKKYYNIGIAVDTPKGLVVPVIKNANELSIKEIAAKIEELSMSGREGKLTLEQMSDGTFTITSYGSLGGLFAVPVINYPQAAILGIGRVSKKPIVKDDQLAIGLVMPLSLTVDHRIADGGESTRFINDLMGYLTNPISMLME